MKTIVYYSFWIVMIAVLLLPKFGWIEEEYGKSITWFVSLKPAKSADQKIVDYILENYPENPVVFVNCEPWAYEVIRFLGMQSTNDVYAAQFHIKSNTFTIHPEKEVYFEELHHPKNPFEGSLTEFLRANTLPSLFIFPTHNSENYELALNHLRETGAYVIFLKQWEYEGGLVSSPFGTPLIMYLVHPLTEASSS